MSQFDFYPDTPLNGLKNNLQGVEQMINDVKTEIGRGEQLVVIAQEKLLRAHRIRAGLVRAIEILEAADKTETPI